MIPGAALTHRVITDDCRRAKSEDEIFDEVLIEADNAIKKLMGIWKVGKGAKIHVAVTVERPQ